MNNYQKTAALAYHKSQVTTVNDLSLIVMLYEGAIRFLKKSLIYIEKRQIEAAHLSVVRAKDIVLELLASIDKKKGGKLAEDLMALYTYIFRLLVDGNINKDEAKIQEAISLMTKLLDGWQSTKIKRADKFNNPVEKIAVLKNNAREKSTSIYG